MKISIIYANAGGGHRSVALSLQEALGRYHPEVSVSVVDIMEEYTPFPMNKFPGLYPTLTKGNGSVWKFLYSITDGKIQAGIVSESWSVMVNHRIQKAVENHSPDLIISVYPLLNRNIGRFLKKRRRRPKFGIMVTDLGTAHYLWFSRHADFYLMPSEMVLRRASMLGVPSHKMRLTGLPVNLAFSEPYDKLRVRKELGLDPDLPTLLLVGGAEGMGPLKKIAEAINDAHPPAQMVVVAGRNDSLKHALQGLDWHMPAKILGFTGEMHKWMKASDLLLSKAGPSTISEAFAVGLPILVTGYLPGQEKANVDFVVSSGAGVMETNPKRIAALVSRLTSDMRAALTRMAENARKAGHPDAAKEAADILVRIASGKTLEPSIGLTFDENSADVSAFR